MNKRVKTARGGEEAQVLSEATIKESPTAVRELFNAITEARDMGKPIIQWRLVALGRHGSH